MHEATGSQFDNRKRAVSSANRISKKVWIKACTETVYDALTDSKQLAQWFCDRATCDASEGKELVAYWKTGKSVQKGRALFTRVVPGSALELAWIDDGDGEREQPSEHTLSYEIRSKSGMTELIMIDKDTASPDEETAEILDNGWNSVLLELKDFCERKDRQAKPKQSPRPRSQRASKD